MTTKAEQITLDLRHRFDAGEFDVGDKFETFAELQKRYCVAGVGTIQAALEPLWYEGILRSEQGRGTFVQRIPPPWPEVSDKNDAASTVDAILSEIAADLAQLGARLEAARALLNPEETRHQPSTTATC
jgi:DNA-binding GntR family transcriptional regulator